MYIYIYITNTYTYSVQGKNSKWECPSLRTRVGSLQKLFIFYLHSMAKCWTNVSKYKNNTLQVRKHLQHSPRIKSYGTPGTILCILEWINKPFRLVVWSSFVFLTNTRLLVKRNCVIYYSQSQLLLVKSNDHWNTNRKAL